MVLVESRLLLAEFNIKLHAAGVERDGRYISVLKGRLHGEPAIVNGRTQESPRREHGDGGHDGARLASALHQGRGGAHQAEYKSSARTAVHDLDSSLQVTSMQVNNLDIIVNPETLFAQGVVTAAGGAADGKDGTYQSTYDRNKEVTVEIKQAHLLSCMPHGHPQGRATGGRRGLGHRRRAEEKIATASITATKHPQLARFPATPLTQLTRHAIRLELKPDGISGHHHPVHPGEVPVDEASQFNDTGHGRTLPELGTLRVERQFVQPSSGLEGNSPRTTPRRWIIPAGPCARCLMERTYGAQPRVKAQATSSMVFRAAPPNPQGPPLCPKELHVQSCPAAGTSNARTRPCRAPCPPHMEEEQTKTLATPEFRKSYAAEQAAAWTSTQTPDVDHAADLVVHPDLFGVGSTANTPGPEGAGRLAKTRRQGCNAEDQMGRGKEVHALSMVLNKKTNELAKA
ncbi:unnamed protein product [Arctogadus glacialis]